MWSSGVLIGLPIVVVLIVLSIVGLAFALRFYRKQKEHERTHQYSSIVEGRIAIGVASAVLILLLVVSTIGLYPWKKEYHYWADTSGTVEVVSSRMINVDKGMKQKFVVRFVGSDQEYGCDDTRCSLIKPGDVLTLSCKRTWQYSGSDGYDCNFKRNKGVQ